ncbi:MAG TPA: PilN domain-containing protein [Haliangiales bacterium]|nr:PilN domain-containing protein [Haliangiales bacterium]
MIRINLLQEKKKGKRRRRQLAAGEMSSGKQLVVGGGIVGAIAVAAFFLLHLPLESSLNELRSENSRRQKTVAALTEDTKEFDAVTAQLNAAKAQEAAIVRLQSVRATPAWMLAELSNLLTKDRRPTMSLQKAEQIKTDVNQQFSPGWDAKRVWITSLEEKEGALRIEGGAQSRSDVTQFILRLQASVYFEGVTPGPTDVAVDTVSKQQYFKFTILAKVMY